MNRMKKFDIFVFLSTFARSMVEVFVPIFLLQRGFSLNDVFIYFIVRFLIVLFFDRRIIELGKKIKFKRLMIISVFLFALNYYFFGVMNNTLVNLIIFSVITAFYNQAYWVGRHFYALEILPNENLGDDVGNIIIFANLAVIPASYLGALIINNYGLVFALIIVIIFMLVSITPLLNIKEKKSRVKKVDHFKVMKKIPRKSLRFFVLDQFRVVANTLFPIYLFYHVVENYEFIGIYNLIVGFASMIFVYFFSRTMDKKKKDYLFLSGLILGVILFFKLNINATLLMLIIGVFEGFAAKAFETGSTRDLYALGKKYDIPSYISMFEMIFTLSRLLIFLFILALGLDVRSGIILCLIGIVLAGFNGFDDGDGGY